MFKLICGLGNCDIENVKALVKLYAKAGAHIFDVSPYALKALNDAITEEGLNPRDFKFCISLPVEGDAHGKKAKILPKKCKKCAKCVKICPQGAIKDFCVDENKCIGCSACKKVCKHGAVKLFDKTDYFNEFKSLLKTNLKLDCVELHASCGPKKAIYKAAKDICKKFKGDFSLCISRKYFSTEDCAEIVGNVRKIAAENSNFYIQADGNSMNFANTEMASTLECAAFALALKEYGIKESQIILSGGTNEYTKTLCDNLFLAPCAIAYGSYARKIVKNLSQKEALIAAKNFVKHSEGGSSRG